MDAILRGRELEGMIELQEVTLTSKDVIAEIHQARQKLKQEEISILEKKWNDAVVSSSFLSR